MKNVKEGIRVFLFLIIVLNVEYPLRDFIVDNETGNLKKSQTVSMLQRHLH